MLFSKREKPYNMRNRFYTCAYTGLVRELVLENGRPIWNGPTSMTSMLKNTVFSNIIYILRINI